MLKNCKLLRKVVATAIVMLTILAVCAIPVSAAEATTYTYILSNEGEWLRTQDAYLVSNIILRSEGLSSPEDIFYLNDEIYIADSGNSRIVVYNIRTQAVRYIGEELLQTPTGVYVYEDGTVYVADSGVRAVFKFENNGKFLKKFERPTNNTFGKNTQYIPSKVAVNDVGTIYTVSEGAYDGIVQLDQQGNFLGYYGYNNYPTSLIEYLQDLFFTEEQKAQLFNKVPYSFANLDMDEKGLIYTVTQSVEGNAVKRHDISGINIFPTDMEDEKNFVDVSVGRYGQIYVLTATGLIFEYDTDGTLLFSMGGLAISQERNGLITTAVAIEADDYGNIYIVDGGRNQIHVMSPTAMANTVHNAMNLYNAGHYEESREVWEQISTVSGDCRIVENGIGNCMYQLVDYKAAAEHYRKAENRDGYSNAYWQIRMDKIRDLLPYFLAAIVVFFIGSKMYERYRKNHPLKPRKMSKFETDMRFVFKMVKHPLDSLYSIRREGAGSMLSASVIYLIAYIVFVFNFIFRGFVVSTNTPQNTSIVYVTLLFAVPVFLFVFGNFFIGEINESEARFRDVYVATAYVTSPFITIMPFIIAFSHVMTQAESRLLSLASVAIYVWVVILLFLSTKEMHAYTVPDVIKNLLITIFFMAVIVLAASLVGMFWDQIAEFIYSIFKEASYRAQG